MQSTEKNFNIRKALTGSTTNKMKKIWKSSIGDSLKVRICRATLKQYIHTVMKHGQLQNQ